MPLLHSAPITLIHHSFKHPSPSVPVTPFRFIPLDGVKTLTDTIPYDNLQDDGFVYVFYVYNVLAPPRMGLVIWYSIQVPNMKGCESQSQGSGRLVWECLWCESRLWRMVLKEVKVGEARWVWTPWYRCNAWEQNMALTPDLSFVTVVANQDVFGFRTWITREVRMPW